jgi:guanidinopropionase
MAEDFMNKVASYDDKYDPRLASRYSELATFMRAPYSLDVTGLDIAMLGIPFDGGVTNRPGARHGPREMRNQSSLMRAIHHVTKVNPFALCKVADVGDVRFDKVMDNEAAMIHIDAHTDTWGEIQGSKFNHGSPFRLATDEGLLDPTRTIQIGIRGPQNSPEGWEYSFDKGMRVVFIEEFDEIGVDAVIAEARKVVGDGPTYISFDVDGLDPVYAPGTGTPESGGITMREAQKLLRGFRGLDLIGGDVVEVAPPFDPSGNTAMNGATLMYEILCLLAEVRAGATA